ncbi:MAG: ABC transporter permease [Clostridia bacterium]|nr:ABC transporter permease [Clostridia bacterium]
MKQFGKILKFELKNYMSNKVFVGVTLFLVIAIAVVMFFPRVMGAFEGDDVGGDGADDVRSSVMLVYSPDTETGEAVKTAFLAAFPGHDVRLCESEEALRGSVEAGESECGFAFESLVSYTYYVGNLSMYDTNTAVADSVLTDMYRTVAMVGGGISAEQAAEIMSVTVSHSTQSLGKDQMQNFFYTYIMIFALYMVILLYGQMVATNVATEKSSRAMEVLITSADPVSMMFGKVIASCLAGLIQLVAVFGSALLCFNLNSSYWGEDGIMASIFDMPVDLFLYMLVFFILGFFIYAFMFGAVGSTASKLEDINTSVMPITLLFVIAFVVVMMSMSTGDVDSILMKVCSYIPFTSPMAMFTRIAMSTVSPVEIAISVGVLGVSVIFVGVFAAKIYRVGVLLYGTKPRLGDILKAIRKA